VAGIFLATAVLSRWAAALARTMMVSPLPRVILARRDLEDFFGGKSVTSSRFVFLGFLVVFIAHIVAPLPSEGDQVKSLVVLIDHDAQGFHYRVDGKSTSSDLLTSLSAYKQNWPTDKTKVILLVHDRTSLSMIDNSRGMIEKSGYEPPRVFYFNGYRRAMVELTFSKAVPFSQDGDLPR